jgi:hypothetical protein
MESAGNEVNKCLFEHRERAVEELITVIQTVCIIHQNTNMQIKKQKWTGCRKQAFNHIKSSGDYTNPMLRKNCEEFFFLFSVP